MGEINATGQIYWTGVYIHNHFDICICTKNVGIFLYLETLTSLSKLLSLHNWDPHDKFIILLLHYSVYKN
jgi:hypothetical protein